MIAALLASVLMLVQYSSPIVVGPTVVATPTFDFYISTTGNDNNPGTVAQPWALTSLQNFTISGGVLVGNGQNVTNWNSTQGKRVGLLPGIYDCATVWNNLHIKVTADTGTFGAYVVLPIKGGGAAQTYIGSSDSTGHYSPRLAVLEAHTTIGNITNITNAVSAVVTTNVTGGSNPYVSGALVAIYGVAGMTQINQMVGTISAPTGVSGSYGFTVNINSTGFGAYTSGGTASTGYPGSGTGDGTGLIGSGQSLPGSSFYGNVTIDGLVVTGVWCGENGAVHFYGKNSNTTTGANGQQGGATGIFVQNCEVYDINGVGGTNNVRAVAPWFVTGMTIRGNRLHDIVFLTSNINIAGILSFNSTGNLYTCNTIYNVTEGVYDKESPNGGHTYSYNFVDLTQSTNPQYGFRDCGGGEIGQIKTCFNNLFVSNSTNDVGWSNFSGPGGHTQTNEIYKVFNNTVIGNGASQYMDLYSKGNQVSPSSTITCYNNIFDQSSGTSNAFQQGLDLCATDNATFGAVALCDYNVFGPNVHWGATTAATGTFLNVDTRYNALTGAGSWNATFGFDAHSTTTAATFTNPRVFLTATGYQLQGGSVGTVGNVPGSSDGTINGSAVQMGCWGGVSPPSTSYTGTIGCGF